MTNTRESIIAYINDSKFTTIYEAAAAIPEGVERIEDNCINSLMKRVIYKDCNKEYFCIQGYYEPFQNTPTPPVQAFRCKKELSYVFVPEYWEQPKITEEQREEIRKQVNDLIGL